MYKPIRSAKAAVSTINDAALIFIVLAVINFLLVSVRYPPGIQVQFAESLIYVVLATMAWRLHSRTAAILLFIQSAGAFIILSYLWITVSPNDFNPGYGPRLILALILTYAAVRMVQGTFLLHGRYAEDRKDQIP